MATQKYTVEKTTIDKIKKLFVYRRINDLLKLSGLDKDKEFVSDIINVQYQIYMLDGYLESKWDLDKKEIRTCWDAIYVSLEAMGFSNKKIAGMIAEIEDYEKIERNCRKDIWPTKVPLKEFYITKSCDVRLIRHLIYLKHPALKDMWKESAWTYYDIITEINDDISDVDEDVKTYNGNRFLISMLRKGTDKTYSQYQSFLESITRKADVYFTEKKDKGKYAQLAAWTMDRSLQTLKLLHEKAKPRNEDKLSASYMLAQMK